MAALNRNDWPAFAAVLAPDMVAVARNRLSWPFHDRTSTVAAVQALVADVPDVVMVERTFDAERDTALTLVDALGHATNGGELHWSYWTVYCAAGGQICRLEVFDFEDESAARTRFEELAREDPRTPYPDNAAVRTWRRSSWLHSFGGD